MTVTIVIADDQDDLRFLLRRYVERDGRFEVVGDAADGERALAVVEATDPDVLLLDLGMPVMDGLEVLASLAGRSRPRTIVLTGFKDPATLEQARRLGAAACLVKGDDFERLTATIAEVAAGGSD